MKNQNDIIFSVVAFVVVGIVFLVSWFTKPTPVIAPAPEMIETKMPTLPGTDVVVADALPGGQNNGSGGGGMGGGGMMGGAPGGMGGPRGSVGAPVGAGGGPRMGGPRRGPAGASGG